MATFTKYPHTENAYHESYVAYMKQKFPGARYYVTEKIHGANLQFCVDFYADDGKFEKGEARVGTRERFLPVIRFFYGRGKGITYGGDPNEKFYNAGSVMCSLEYRLIQAACNLAEKKGNATRVIFYGEIYGGLYNHPDVPKDKDAIKVSKGVNYSPHNRWRCFDIAICYGAEKVYREYLSGLLWEIVCANYEIPTVPVLLRDACLQDCLDYPANGESTVYLEDKELPKIEDNIMEGVVIKPWNDDLWLSPTDRAALKNKCEEFRERSRGKVHEHRAPKVCNMPPELKEIAETMQEYITIARVDNVISHIGEVTIKDIGRVIAQTMYDIIDEYDRENVTRFSKLKKADQKVITRALNPMLAKLVREYMLAKF